MNIRSRIVEESTRLFVENGIKPITMDYIARKLGISKRTLYENFSDKEQLLDESVDAFIDWRRKEQDILVESNNNCIEIYLAFYTSLKKGFELVNRNFFRELKRYYPNIYRKIEEVGNDRVVIQIEMLDRGKELGLIREDVDTNIASQLFRLQFDMLCHSDFFSFKEYTMNEVMSTVILNFVRGIASAEGLRIVDEYIEKTKI